MIKAKLELLEAACCVNRVIQEPDAYVAADDLPELVEIRDKIQELQERAMDREEDDLRALRFRVPR